METYVVYCVDKVGDHMYVYPYEDLKSATAGYTALADLFRRDRMPRAIVEVCLYHEPYGHRLRSTSEEN